MSDQKFPNYGDKSNQYLFKKKLPLRRKSRLKLLRESLLMIIVSFLIFFINSFIPSKEKLFKSFFVNLIEIYNVLKDLLAYVSELLLVLFLLFSWALALILIVGSLYRIFRIIRKKRKNFMYINSSK